MKWEVGKIAGPEGGRGKWNQDELYEAKIYLHTDLGQAHSSQTDRPQGCTRKAGAVKAELPAYRRAATRSSCFATAQGGKVRRAVRVLAPPLAPQGGSSAGRRLTPTPRRGYHGGGGVYRDRTGGWRQQLR